MLEQVGTNFSGISSNVAPIGIFWNLSNWCWCGSKFFLINTGIGTLLEDSFDSSIDGEFRMVLKKLAKKDNSTKQKVLTRTHSIPHSNGCDIFSCFI